jgi:hypothetical protein
MAVSSLFSRGYVYLDVLACVDCVSGYKLFNNWTKISFLFLYSIISIETSITKVERKSSDRTKKGRNLEKE